jgi:vacuolar-type H+-ATPase subunit H
MAKEKKVHIRDTPKYTSSSYEEFSDDEVDYSDLFKGLDRSKADINELIDALNEKDRLLEKQEDTLYDEHDKIINVQKSPALEIKKNEILSSELSTCHDFISSFKHLNDDLNTKLEKFNEASSRVEHVVICNRCKYFNIDACNEHVSTNLNNDVASLNAQLKTCKDNYEKLKFARDTYTIGRHPSIKDELGFQKGTKNLTRQRTSNLNKEKGKAPIAGSSQKN